MPVTLKLDDLIEYTDFERGVGHEWLRKHDDQVLAIKVGSL